MSTFVIVGGGLAAGKAAAELRKNGFTGDVVVVTDEPEVPYERPPLSKGYLQGKAERDSTYVNAPEWYAENDVELRTGTAVTQLDLTGHKVLFDGGSQSYDKLLLTTGAKARHLALADDSGAPVSYLRTLGDSDRLKEFLQSGKRIVIIGGGWIGLEVAASARMAGADVTVLESLLQPLLRVLGPEVAERLAQVHRDHGVDLRTGVEITGIDVDQVHLADGTSVPADLIVVGVGVLPNDDLATAAGLATDNGVLVDTQLRTSDDDVYAAGDVANHDHPTLGRRIRVEHWDTAIGQAETAARNMLGGSEEYTRLPYFFSDQYDVGLEYVGSVGPEGYDDVQITDKPDGTFIAYWSREGRIVAGMHFNDWDAIDEIRQRVGA